MEIMEINASGRSAVHRALPGLPGAAITAARFATVYSSIPASQVRLRSHILQALPL
jgi:hypothetical protein